VIVESVNEKSAPFDALFFENRFVFTS